MLHHRIFNHHNFYIWGLILLAISLPLSMFGMSVALIGLSLNWILEGEYFQKWQLLKKRKSIVVFLGVYLVHILWLIISSDLEYGVHDLKIKLPLLALPIIIGTSRVLKRNEFRNILDLFVLAVIMGSFISMGVLFGIGDIELTNIREISILISHIRFALMIVLAIFLWGYMIVKDQKVDFKFSKALRLAGIFWLITFLFILKSSTGLVILLILCFIGGLIVIIRTPNFMLRYFLCILMITVFLLLAMFTVRFYSRFSYVEPDQKSILETFTPNGRMYVHNTQNMEVENGYFVWLHVCEEELEPEWGRRSNLDYYGIDGKGQELRMTLIRYLSSKGIKKDSLGLASLTGQEINWIESGIANVIYTEGFTFYGMFYEIFWQLHMYRLGGNPTGHSVTQRLEYLKAGWLIFGNNFWFGVGTGDVPDAFFEQYVMMDSNLADEWRLRAHNQFLTFGIAFGLSGFILVMFSFLYPIRMEAAGWNYYFWVFLCITLLSMIAEDTLETSSGAMFVGYFYSLFLFNSIREKNE